jgi:altronate hydrolase
MINDFKQYYLDHDQVIYDNPSPGNKAGGISTLEDKSLGCIQKGGSATVMDILAYGEQVVTRGLNLLSGPGNDMISITALTAAGSHIILFTTGRGTPLGAPSPTIKIASNTAIFAKKKHWMDFDAGPIVNGCPINELADDLMRFVIDVASGRIHTCSEMTGLREIAIFKDGVIL